MKTAVIRRLLTLLLLGAMPALGGSLPSLMEMTGINPISGESQDQFHPNAIEVNAFSFGASNPSGPRSGGGGAGKVSFSDLNITKSLDKASPMLYLRTANGQHVDQVKLFVRKNDAKGAPVDYYMVTLVDVIVTSTTTSGTSGGDRPTESVTLNFAKIGFTYKPQKPDGSFGTAIVSGWDVVLNKAWSP